MTSDYELMDYRGIAPLEAKSILRDGAGFRKQQLINAKRVILPSRRRSSTNLETIRVGGKPKKSKQLGLCRY